MTKLGTKLLENYAITNKKACKHHLKTCIFSIGQPIYFRKIVGPKK